MEKHLYMYNLHKIKEGFILTSNENVKDKDWFIINKSEIYQCLKLSDGQEIIVFNKNGDNVGIPRKNCKKVIAQQEQIDFSSLTEEEQKKIGYFDVEKLSLEDYPITNFEDEFDYRFRYGFINGFKNAQELLSDRRFTLKEMVSCFNAAREYRMKNVFTYDEARDYIHSISQKSWKVEIELEEQAWDFLAQKWVKYGKHLSGLKSRQIVPKLTNNKVKIIKLL